MTRNRSILLAAFGSLALLLGALGFQFIGGLAPCHLCLLQRWPHLVAICIGALALLIPGRVLPLLGAAAALTTAGLGLYHAGVEQKWWEGPNTCTSGDISGLSASDLTEQLLSNTTVIQCDQIAWSMAGISMAGWNALISLALVAVWLMAVRRS